MRTTVALIATLLLLASPIAHAQDSRTALEAVARAMGADSVKTLEYTGAGVNFAPPPANTPPPVPPASFAVNLADNITRRGLHVDRLLPLHGRIVPLVDLHRAIGRAP